VLTVLMKWISAGACAALLVSQTLPNFGFALALIVFGGASAVVFQAVRAGKYPWAAVFVLVALAFNPLVPVALSSRMTLVLYGTSTVLFIFSMRLRTVPRMTISSITEMTPPRRSL